MLKTYYIVSHTLKHPVSLSDYFINHFKWTRFFLGIEMTWSPSLILGDEDRKHCMYPEVSACVNYGRYSDYKDIMKTQCDTIMTNH